MLPVQVYGVQLLYRIAASTQLQSTSATTSPLYKKLAIPNKGHGLVATQDIATGTVVLSETPVAAIRATDSVCSRCLSQLSNTLDPLLQCQQCNAAQYCSAECASSDLPVHRLLCRCQHTNTIVGTDSDGDSKLTTLTNQLVTTYITQIMSAGRQKQQQSSDATVAPVTPNTVWHQCLQHLCYMRLSANDTHITNYTRLLQQLAHKLNMRESILQQIVPIEMYLRILGIIHLNTFAVFNSSEAGAAASEQQQIGSSLFATASLLNHACQPNVQMQWTNQQSPSSKSYAQYVATRPVMAGAELTVSYLDDSWPLQQRQEHLSWAYGFQCECDRCQHETEMSGRSQQADKQHTVQR